MLPESLQLLLVGAELLRAVSALEIFICVFREPFRMSVKCNFPPDKQKNRQEQEAPGVLLPDKKQRSEHHRVVPVVNPAGAAAFVLHKQ